ncbi:hypothetical protein EDB89DRAFT_2069551 [Lactarius sanguifluus]|nr:hypothetical protein EDB89DRAFT_2069551 [Lactarius sanguifluus]
MSHKCSPVIQDLSEPKDHDGLPRAAGSIPLGRASIGVLSDDVLLVVFGFYRVSSRWNWHRVAHVCQRWRLVVFASPRSLDLRLYCTPRTAVKNTIDCWPAFPIAIRCGRSQHAKEGCEHLSPEDEDNVVAALQHHNRVCSIKLCLTNSLVEKLDSRVKEPFLELEDLVLRPIFGRHLFPSPPLRWSSRLRVLHLTDISFPSLPLLLSTSQNLVDLHLRTDTLRSPEFPSTWALVDALSGMTRLESLSLYTHSSAFLRTHAGVLLPSGRRVVLPVLARLEFRGICKYLEDLVTEIDAPCLKKIELTFFNHPGGLSQLGKFIYQIEAQRSYSRAEFRTDDPNYAAIRFDLSGCESPHLLLRTRCKGLDMQLSSMAHICILLPPFLLGMRDLGIITSSLSSDQVTVAGEKWLRLLRPFSGVERFYVGGELAIDIMHALQQAEGEFATVVPALHKLYVIKEPELLCAPLQAAIASFTTSRHLSGSPVKVVYRRPLA